MIPFIKHPFAMSLNGPSGAGKTFWLRKFLKYAGDLCDTKFDRILLYYAEWQEMYQELGQNIEYHEGLPQNSDFNKKNNKRFETKIVNHRRFDARSFK